MGNRPASALRPDGMWKLLFFERNGLRVRVDRSAPWLPGREAALTWAQYYRAAGYHVALQSQDGKVEALGPRLPG